MADPPRVAPGRIEALGPLYQPGQLAPQRAQFGDATIEFGGPDPEKVQDMTARCGAAVPKGDDAADLAEGQPHRLRGADEGEAIEYRFLVVPVTRRRPWGRGEQTDVFVVADRLARDPRPPGHITDSHLPLTFQCTGSFTVA
jgi:hypothetical protein